MRLASYVVSGREEWGVVLDDAGTRWVVNPARAAAFLDAYAAIGSSFPVGARPVPPGGAWPATLVELLALEDAGMTALGRLAADVERFIARVDATLLLRAGHRLDDVELLAPIPRPRLYWGLVTNSPSFVRSKPGIGVLNLFPLAHQRPQGAAIGHGAAITVPADDDVPRLAYNVELAVVIGKQGRYIPLERAMEHVAGYTVVNDVSSTYYYDIVPGNDGVGYGLPPGYDDWLYQATASWGGKKADTLAPMGPYLVTRESVSDPYDLLMYTRQSGLARDRAHSGATLMGIERVIQWYSSFATLYPGDVIHLGTMGVDGLPVHPDDVADPGLRLEVEVEGVGALANPVRVGQRSEDDGGGGRQGVDPHPSYAVRQVVESGEVLMSPDEWSASGVRHLWTSFGNHEESERLDGLPRLEVPRFLNGPSSALGTSGADVEIPPRATDLVVGVELAFVVRALTSRASDASGVLLGFTPLISLCDQSFAEAVAEPARVGERGIPAVYGRWADGFNVVLPAPTPLGGDWRGRSMTLRVGDRTVTSSTSDYVAGPDELVRTISARITLFPGDVVTLGATSARIRVTRGEYEAGLVVTASIDGVGDVEARLAP
ncbi:fumarylacetoacetate (FAA) hydrolase [Beutenbergia cavernae DSM 12333]|uniref:Fumarylacetoacetate (FAA) hydrolase n=1 Tax=Beutenbergia cavernae (strain ATCC BAA-8 / DSM 12333 / CCUG 43141 / JCM 11478 / NBRC 16432 / NCIMB 13614 / HKI 0122) TaxID=471853 RepID=C5C260_BEUC1|nr:fumarylacetoacetate hydrolase family protein [Beutenbergia cavernae]ACQ81685.1 fumarylacetoacetate (FAA) hydrolase [Beutenbergia cavernae DSM 12333]